MVKTVRGSNKNANSKIVSYLTKKFSVLRKNKYQEGSMERNSQVIKKIRNDESIFLADNGEKLSINNSRLASSGNSTNEEDSKICGLNSAILSKKGSRINVKDSTVTTTGRGASAIFSYGENSIIDVDNLVIRTRGQKSYGIAASSRGTVQAHDVSINTESKNSPAIAACMENGIIDVANSSVLTEKENSPCVFSRGSVVINDSTLKSELSEAVVVDGSSVVSNNSSMTSRDVNAVRLYQGNEKNGEIGKCVFTSNLGSITATKGAIFYVTNTEAIVTLFNTRLILSNENMLIKACKGEWGTEGKNGAQLTLMGNHQTLKGDIICDEISSVSMNLRAYTFYTGVINADKKGKVDMDLDTTSLWTLTGDSYINNLVNESKDFKNIADNGYNIYYNSESDKNKWLEGKEITLSGGGKLIPV